MVHGAVIAAEMVAEPGHTGGVLVLREEEKSDLAHLSSGALFITRRLVQNHRQAVEEIEQKSGGGTRNYFASISIGIYHSRMKRAKVFMNGRSQAIRLPKEFRVRSGEVYLQKTNDGFQVLERDPWETFVEGCEELSDEAISRAKQPRLEKRERI